MNIKKINNNWKFWNEKNAFALVWNVPKEAEEIVLPHDAMIGNKLNPDAINSVHSGFRDSNAYVYVKKLFISSKSMNRQLSLKFEGIHMNSFVYINEQLAGKCPFGYTSFYVEMNDFIRFDEENEIRVVVKNGAMANSRWYSGGGIYRDVYLLESDLTYIQPDGLQISTDYIQEAYATLKVSTEIMNKHYQRCELELEIIIEDPLGMVVANEKFPLTIMSNAERIISQRINVKNPNLWSDTSPDLYSCKARLIQNNEVIEESVTLFGIRTVEIDAINGLRINGESVKLRGACIHHDSGIIGAATYEDAQYRQISRLKNAGFNAIRMAHNPVAPAMLRACDELGMYIMEEAFDMWTRGKTDYDYSLFFNEWWKKDIEAMVRKDFNHPSVIIYSIGNEIPEIGTDHGSNLCNEISDKIKSLDSTRYTLASINGVFASGDLMDIIVEDVVADLKEEGTIEGNVNHFMALMEDHMDRIVLHPLISKRLEKACAATDIAGYNYMTSRYEEDGKAYPNRVIVGSETYPPAIAKNWEEVTKLSHVIGDFTWTGWDYLGEAGVGIPAYSMGEGGFSATYPCNIAYCGDFDITGFRRPASYYREIVFGLRTRPYITVQNPYRYGQKVIKTPWIISDSMSSWTWPNCENKPIIVEIYSAGDEVELLCNNQSLGKSKAGASVGFITYFDTSYTQGELIAITYKDGSEIGRERLVTAKKARRLKVGVEQGENHELIFVDFKVVDENNTLCTDEVGLLEIQVEGEMSLLGFGTGDPKSLDGFNETSIHLFEGRGQAIISFFDRLKNGKISLKYTAKNGVLINFEQFIES